MALPDIFIHWIYLCIFNASFSVAVNGALEGFFTSARAEEGKFGYHTRCQEVKLTHLSFADDILVFTDGTSASLFGVLEVFKDFASTSGLHINPSKSTLFSAGEEANQLVVTDHRVGIQSGTLPIRYLGLTLTTKALTRLDYEPLLNRIQNEFLLWSHKSLSYAGRLQLIKTVITRFPHDKQKAKVAWETACSPKSEGGLGLRSLDQVVSATGKIVLDSLEMGNGSWIWRKLLKLRDIACQFLRIEVKDGLDTFFWHDNWLHLGKLIDITGPAGPNLLGIPLNAKVTDAQEITIVYHCINSNA
ncbi:uncharacterized protein LOC106393375 [Brassica napus]|uniref:uncharacterized protein LOC106393375 n=1 Tax=Brassica napus TaxID=3708 RepID=UPI0020785C94|nr:uncharacterized protein LOC106393375 [Brassica napus]